MKRVVSAALAVAALILAAAVAVQAQSLPQRVNIPFKFALADKDYPPSFYYFRYEPSSNHLEVMTRDRNLLARLPVVTRLARKPGDKDDGNVKLIFDQVGQERFLSEVWFPASDGYLLHITPEKHQHQILEGGEK
jgi:hypothetical protein